MTQKGKLGIIFATLVVIGGGLVVYWLAWGSHGLVAGFNSEFMVRDDGYPGLKKLYGLDFGTDNVRQMETGLMYKACRDGDVDVICGFSTDGLLGAYNLKMLEDDKDFWPPYYACPVVRGDTLSRHPELREALGKLAGRIDNDTMQDLNYRATQAQSEQEVARAFLVEVGLIEEGAEPGDGSAGEVVVASKNFTEQAILGDMMGLLIEHETNLAVTRKRNLSTLACNTALQAGDVDMYAEYTGTALVTHLKMKPRKDPEEVYDIVEREYKDRWDLVWLEPFGFENRYTLTMRPDRAKELGIETISDLARYVNEHKD